MAKKKGNPAPKTAHLEPYKWKPGESGNPSGRPRKPLSEAYTAILNEVFPGDPKKRTYAQLIAEGQAKSAIKGKTDAAREIADRVEGKTSLVVDADGNGGEGVSFVLEVRFTEPAAKPGAKD